jgi:hypothetical protein
VINRALPLVLSEDELKKRRSEAVADAVVHLGASHDMKFTCDTCGVLSPQGKRDCQYAFDLYNTDGDCLAEK